MPTECRLSPRIDTNSFEDLLLLIQMAESRGGWPQLLEKEPSHIRWAGTGLVRQLTFIDKRLC